MYVIYSLAALCAGLLFAVQGSVNSELGIRTDKFQATLISFSGGLAALIVIVLLFGNGDLTQLSQAKPWQLIGGLYGALGVCVSVAGVPVLGVALTLMASQLGQLVMALFIDSFGLFQQPSVAVSPLRVLGILAVACGILLIYAANRKAKTNTAGKVDRRAALMLLIVFVTGLACAIQSPTNASLSSLIGQWESTMFSFFGGTVVILIATMVFGRGKLKPMRGVGIKPWMCLGGLLGIGAVFINLVTVVTIGTTLQVACVLLGQLIGGVVIDTFGLLGVQKVRITPLRLGGIAAVTAGVILVTAAKML